MPSDNNHIDHFFLRKEEESNVDTGQVNTHWQQMQQLMQPPVVTVSKSRRVPVWMRYAAALLLIGITAVVVLQTKNNNRIARNDNPPANTSASIPDTGQSARSINPAVNDSLFRNQNVAQQSLPGKNVLSAATPSHPVVTSIVAFPRIVPDSTQEPAVVSNAEAATTFYSQLKKKVQVFSIYGNRDTTLYCKEGSELHFPAGALQTATGVAVTGLVNVYVQEFYSMADIIGNKLNTVSDGLMLITGGMLNIRALTGEEELMIKPGRSVGLKMPTQRFSPEMQLFKGEEQAVIHTDLKKQNSNTPVLRFRTQGDTLLIPSDETSAVTSTAYFAGNRINWKPLGQKQSLPPDLTGEIKVLNLMDNPVSVRHGRKTVAKFLIPLYSPVSDAFIQQELERRYGHFYDVIKVKREWKIFGALHGTSGGESWPDTKYVGDSVVMNMSTALSNKLISAQEIARLMEEKKKRQEQMINNRESWNTLNQVRDEYSFQLENLGWVNCDRFYNTPGLKTDFVLNTGMFAPDMFTEGLLIFERFNAVMPGYFLDGKIHFDNLPVNEPVTAICIGAKNGKVYTAMLRTSVSRKLNNELPFEETSPEEFKEKMKHLGNVKSR